MLSNSCRYGIRAVIYLASYFPGKNNIGIKKISEDLKLPTPYLAKILQQLVKNKILDSTKGPNGGFSLHKKPESITLLDIVKIIDGDNLIKNCIIHDGFCAEVRRNKKACPLHNDYSVVRENLIRLFRRKTVAELVKEAKELENILI